MCQKDREEKLRPSVLGTPAFHVFVDILFFFLQSPNIANLCRNAMKSSTPKSRLLSYALCSFSMQVFKTLAMRVRGWSNSLFSSFFSERRLSPNKFRFSDEDEKQALYFSMYSVRFFGASGCLATGSPLLPIPLFASSPSCLVLFSFLLIRARPPRLLRRRRNIHHGAKKRQLTNERRNEQAGRVLLHGAIGLVQ